ncbi:MAG: hypothetical protein KTM48_04210 [Wolbachia endosymbiont of Pissodes strobi]|nr:hypothetical protein [Wolbachia endosymbiont of Pissodes strobi]
MLDTFLSLSLSLSLSFSLFPWLVLGTFTASLICTLSLSHTHITYLHPFLIVVAKHDRKAVSQYQTSVQEASSGHLLLSHRILYTVIILSFDSYRQRFEFLQVFLHQAACIHNHNSQYQ